MAVTKATYTATGTWTAAQLATIFESAFVASGLMSAWHDSFLSGSVENRILAVTYDGGATYGTTYYWFMFTTSGAYLHVATGWDVGSHIPSGTQYLDYFSTTTNATSNHWQFFSGASTSTATLTRYTSGADADQSWFVINNGTVRRAFTITPATMTLQSWLDLDKGFYNGFSHVACKTGASRHYGAVQFMRGPGLRRDLMVGTALNGTTTNSDYITNVPFCPLIAYGAPGNASSSIGSNIEWGFSTSSSLAGVTERYPGTILLPTGLAATNPAYASNSNPVFHSLPHNPYVVDPLPADFGLTLHYATNSFSVGDTMVVTASVEEWEVLEYAANASAVTGASPLFLARTT
jgi:hypothetical protein